MKSVKLNFDVCEKENSNGGESLIVGELSSVVYFELEAFPEPKALNQSDFEHLFQEQGTISGVAESCGLSWSAVQERIRPTRQWDAKKSKFVKIRRPKIE